MAKVKQGKILEVENKNRKFGANSKYFAIWTENAKKEEQRKTQKTFQRKDSLQTYLIKNV